MNQIRLHFSKNLRFYDLNDMENEHQQLLNAFRTKDPATAAQAIVKHLDSDNNMLCFED